MRQAMTLAAIAACTNLVEANMSPKRAHALEAKGVDLDLMYRRAENYVSRASRTLHKSELKSYHLQTIHKAKQAKALYGAEFDEQVDEETQNVIDYICGENLDDCDTNQIDKVTYVFDTLKGIVVGVTAVYSDECRGGLIGLIDSALALYNHIEVYLPQNFNKFGIAFNDLIQSSNIIYAYCDITHLYNELAKLTDYQDWEQYIELACRWGGVFIEDLWSAIEVINSARTAGDGYAAGTAGGQLTSLFLDIMM